MTSLREDIATINQRLLSDDFLSSTVDQVRSVKDKYTQVHILQTTLEEVLKAKKKTAADEAKEKVEEMAALTNMVIPEEEKKNKGSNMI